MILCIDENPKHLYIIHTPLYRLRCRAPMVLVLPCLLALALSIHLKPTAPGTTRRACRAVRIVRPTYSWVLVAALGNQNGRSMGRCGNGSCRSHRYCKNNRCSLELHMVLTPYIFLLR